MSRESSNDSVTSDIKEELTINKRPFNFNDDTMQVSSTYKIK
jgi:hypothetical protein